MELRESFRKPFVQTAWQRHGRVVDLVHRSAERDAPELKSAASELHCLSGEASMLDFSEVAELARSAEQAAREGDKLELGKLVNALQRAIKAIELGSP